MKKLLSIIGPFPRLEVLLRNIYWNYPAVHGALIKLKKGLFNTRITPDDAKFTLLDLKAEIEKHGIVPGSILIVHSAMTTFRHNGITEKMLIDMFLEILGPKGTLVLPAIPRYREAPEGIDRITKDISGEVWTYDVQKTLPWTGTLPFVLMRTQGAKRGRHPLNTVVAKGAEVDKLFERELSVEGALPCGPESPWAYCWNKNAKILALDVDLAHSLTMIHVAEDCFEDTWPIPNWYRNRTFNVVDEGNATFVTVRERCPKWAKHIAERKLARDMRTLGLSHTSELGGASITSIESSELIEFLSSKRAQGFPYYLWKNIK